MMGVMPFTYNHFFIKKNSNDFIIITAYKERSQGESNPQLVLRRTLMLVLSSVKKICENGCDTLKHVV